MSDVPSVIADPEFVLSSDAARIDREWVARSVLASYWGGWLTREQILAALDESLVIGAYVGDKMVGFVRIVSDFAIFSSITDMLVDEAYRGRGIGSALLKAAVSHEGVGRTICILQAKPEAWLWYYSHADFHVIDKRHGIMKRMPR